MAVSFTSSWCVFGERVFHENMHVIKGLDYIFLELPVGFCEMWCAYIKIAKHMKHFICHMTSLLHIKSQEQEFQRQDVLSYIETKNVPKNNTQYQLFGFVSRFLIRLVLLLHLQIPSPSFLS